MKRWCSLTLLIVLAYATVLGYFAWNTFFWYVPPDYRKLRWEASWVSPPRRGPQLAYFRKKLNLTSKPAHAWLAVMARDSFTLYVNGKLIGNTTYAPGYAQGVFDLTTNLVTGINVIAIVNKPISYHEPPRIVVEGQYGTWSGETFSIRSDATWRTASRNESLNAQGKLVVPTPWYATTFDDGDWSYVVQGDTPHERLVQSQALAHPLMTEPLHSPWLWTQNSSAPEAYFRLALDTSERPRDAWVRIAARREYRLLVNGYPIATNEAALATEAAMPTSLDLYNITTLLKRGRNVVAVQAANDRTDQGLIVDGFVQGPDGNRAWFSPAAWTASEVPVDGWETAAGADPPWKPAVAMKPVTPTDQSFLVKQVATPVLPLFFELKAYSIAAGLVAAALIGCLALWACSTTILARLTGDEPHAVARWLPLTFLPSLGLLSLAYFLGFDGRLSLSFPFQPRFVWGSVALLLLLHGILIVAAALPFRAASGASFAPKWWTRVVIPRWMDFGWLGAGALMVLGFILRFKDLAYEPFRGDEASYVLATVGILDRGYPSVTIDGMARPGFTSELTHYLKSVFPWFVGVSPMSVRFTDVIFGTLTIALIYWAGKVLHSRRVGLLGATLYTILPTTIGLTHYARYPSILQFWALLTFVLLFRALGSESFQPRPWYLAVVTFIATYLTWEGSAYYGPALALGILVLTRGNFSWLKNRHLWVGMSVIGVLVFVQLALRTISKVDWPQYGTGAGDVQPALVFLYPFYQPWYYIEYFFLVGTHHFMTLVFVLGAPLWFRRSRDGRVLGYLAMTLIVDIFMMTNFLELQAWRYVYSSLPFLLLAACITLVIFTDHFVSVCRSVRAPGRLLHAFGRVTATALVTAGLLVSTEFVLKPFNNPWSYTSQYTRPGLWNGANTAGAAAYILDHLLPGDRVISVLPHVYQFEMKGVALEFLESILRLSVVLGVDPGTPRHRLTGDPNIVSLDEMNEVLAHSPRIWLTLYDVTGPAQGLDQQLMTTLQDTLPVVYEDVHAVVYLLGGRR